MHVLIIDDEPTQRLLLRRFCETFGFTTTEAENGEHGVLLLQQAGPGDYSIVLTDLYMAHGDGRHVVKRLRELHPLLPVIVITAENNEQIADELKRLGAQDFLTKPIDMDRLRISIDNAVQMRSLREEVARLQRRSASDFRLDDLIGAYSGLSSSVATARKYARSDMPVLLLGESGVGKEMFAHAIHGDSHRCDKPFIALNCGAIPPNLVESTLFGHEKGAFTGAIERTLGKFREAEGGTLFLDEVGELPAQTQVKLLRALQQSEVEPVGLGRNVPVNVRIISATNRSLEADISKELFRRDLYFRLAVLPLELPPLRQRRSDIPLFCEFFLKRTCARERLPEKYFDATALEWACGHDWPGNVRELENTVMRAALLSDSEVITAADFGPSALHSDKPAPAAAAFGATPAATAATEDRFYHPGGTPKTLEELTLNLVQHHLERTNGSINEAATATGIAVSTLYRRIREWKKDGKLAEIATEEANQAP